ncbi:hypothetical protein NE237_018728 [Protea cynaroides]|uniref:Polygalacturonase n=1 Tax=Protea cynaroides TaxID=273540 RepID=A0A9Q0KAJ1_9MAGN|nr:hypothetical protein NE237_018728 [Protea cynaroides]
MGCSRDLLLITCLIGLLQWRAQANLPTPSFAAPTKRPGSRGMVFDVTNFGAVCDGKTDNNKAFLAAWDAACKFPGPSTFYIPEGNYYFTPVTFLGPCYNQLSPHVKIRGNLIAPSGWANSNTTWIVFETLSQLHISGGGVGTMNGKGDTIWMAPRCSHTNDDNCGMPPTTMQFVGIKGGSLGDITSMNSKAFHIIIMDSTNFIFNNVTILAPEHSPNTDGVHIGDSDDIRIINSRIGTGDDCISIGPGSSNVNISNVECGPGHGISVGSLGRYPNEKEVRTLRVTNCTLINTTNGVRIKTWAGAPDNSVSDFIFENINMINVTNPIIIDQKYCDHKSCDQSKPSRVKLSNIHYRNIKGTSFSKNAVSITCSDSMPCERVELVDIELKSITAGGNVTAVCLNAKGVASGVLFPTGCELV